MNVKVLFILTTIVTIGTMSLAFAEAASVEFSKNLITWDEEVSVTCNTQNENVLWNMGVHPLNLPPFNDTASITFEKNSIMFFEYVVVICSDDEGKTWSNEAVLQIQPPDDWIEVYLYQDDSYTELYCDQKYLTQNYSYFENYVYSWIVSREDHSADAYNSQENYVVIDKLKADKYTITCVASYPHDLENPDNFYKLFTSSKTLEITGNEKEGWLLD